MSQGDAVSNPFELTTVSCFLKIRTDSADTDGVTRHASGLEENAPVAITVDLAVRQANPGAQAAIVRGGDEDLVVKLRESLSDYLADRLVSAWQIGPYAGSLAQVADEANAAADGIHILVEIPVEKAATVVGVPQCPAEVGAGVIATFLTEPVTSPISDLATLIEIAGVIIGLVANIHPLTWACANRLAKKEITDLVAKAIVEAMNSLGESTNPTDALAEEPTASQVGPQDQAGARPTLPYQRQLDALRKAGDIGPEAQSPAQVQNHKTTLRGTDDPDQTATDIDVATNATWELDAI